MAFETSELHSLPLLDYLDALGYSYRQSGSDSYTDVEAPDGHLMSSFVYTKSKNVWYYNAGGLSGYGAWDYVRKIEGVSLSGDILARLEQVMGVNDEDRAAKIEARIQERNERNALVQVQANDDGIFRLPPASPTINQLKNGLCGRRCIDKEVLQYFVDRELLYESNEPFSRQSDGAVVYYHNAVFVARDEFGEAKAASCKYITPVVDQATGKERFPAYDVPYSDHKHYLPSYFSGRSDLIVVFESVVDALSYLTMQKMKGRTWNAFSFISLEGAAGKYTVVPHALRVALDSHPDITHIVLALDNDKTGMSAMGSLEALLQTRYKVSKYAPPKTPRKYTKGKDEYCKDWGDLCIERVRAQKAAAFMSQVEGKTGPGA